jgi:hypothetical protein
MASELQVARGIKGMKMARSGRVSEMVLCSQVLSKFAKTGEFTQPLDVGPAGQSEEPGVEAKGASKVVRPYAGEGSGW